jgi:hypothetical protein
MATTLVKTNRETVRTPLRRYPVIDARMLTFGLLRATPDIQFRLVESEFSGDGKSTFPSSVHRDIGVCFLKTPASGNDQWRTVRPSQMENVMRGRVMMILASAVLAGSLLATGAQARGGGGGGGHGGGGFGGGHMGGFGDGHMGGGFDGGHMAGMGRDHFRGGSGFYDDGLGCPYYGSYTWPYNCDY